MNAKAETQSISQEYDLPHPPAKVWRALTEPELLAAWLMANDMRPTVGHSFTFKQQPMPWWDGIVHCEVLEIDLHKRLRYSWRSGPGVLASGHRGHVGAHADGHQVARGSRLNTPASYPAMRPRSTARATGWRRMVGERLSEVLARAA